MQGSLMFCPPKGDTNDDSTMMHDTLTRRISVDQHGAPSRLECLAIADWHEGLSL